jgi:hypothetical protein
MEQNMAIGALISAGASILGGLLKGDEPEVKVAKEQAAAQKHISNNQVKMNADNNDTTLESQAMMYERSDISEQRWVDFAYDTAVPMGMFGAGFGHFPLPCGYGSGGCF